MSAATPDSSHPPTRPAQIWLERLVVALVALAIYLPAIDAPFVFDDLMIVQDNTFVTENDAGAILTSGYWDGHDQEMGRQQALYRPLTVLSYAWNWALVGDLPGGFRIVNILLHALASVLVTALVGRLTGSRLAAICGGLVFAAHPVHTEAVTYVSGRADLLAAVGFLGAWLAHAWRPERGRRGLLLLSLTLFALGLLAKEMAATLPAVLMLFDLAGARRAGATVREAWGAVRRRLPTYGAYFGVLALFLLLRGAVLGGLLPAAGDIPLQANPLRDLGLLERLDDATAVLGRELALLVWPHPLSIDYSFDALPVSAAAFAAENGAWVALALSALLVGLVGIFRPRGALLGAGLLFFFGTLFPVSNLAFVIGTNLGERVLYLSSFTLSLVVGLGAAVAARRSREGAWVALALTVALTAVLGWRTLVRNGDYASGYRLFQAAAEAYPRASRAQYNFGVYAAERSVEHARAGEGEAAAAELELALAAFRTALEVDPQYAEAHYEVARLAQQRGDLATAFEHFEAVLTLGAAARLPDAVPAFADCALARGDAERGRRVLRQHVQGVDALRGAYELAQGLFEVDLGNDVAARTHFERVLAGPEPGDESARRPRLRARVELARLAGRAGQEDLAERLFAEAVAGAGPLIGPHLARLAHLREAARWDALETALAEAEAAFPGHFALLTERGQLARARGDGRAALEAHLAALAAQPGHRPSRRALVELGRELLARVESTARPSAEAQVDLRVAETALRSALQLGVRQSGLQFDHFRALAALGRWREAAAGFDGIASRRGPRADEALLRAGQCFAARGDAVRARRAFEAVSADAEHVAAARQGLLRLRLATEPERVAQELALVPGQDRTPELDTLRLFALQALGDRTRLLPALADFESRHGEHPEALVVRALAAARQPSTAADATLHADRALALARPGTFEFVRVAQGLAELYRLTGEASDERRMRQELETWGPEPGGS